METLKSKVNSFSFDAKDAEKQCADIFRAIKRLSSGNMSPELEAISNSFGTKITSLEDEDPRQKMFTDIFDRIMFGIDFEYNICEFVKVMDAYRAKGCSPFINRELRLISNDLTIKSQILCRHGTEDIDAIVPVLKTTIKRLPEICGNTELSDHLANMFKSTLKQYDSERQLDASIAKFRHAVENLY